MEDTLPAIEAPWVECSPTYDCGFQGIQKGWADSYGATLPCQFIDVTDIPDGRYLLEVEINTERRFDELSLENNRHSVEVVIGTPPFPSPSPSANHTAGPSPSPTPVPAGSVTPISPTPSPASAASILTVAGISFALIVAILAA